MEPIDKRIQDMESMLNKLKRQRNDLMKPEKITNYNIIPTEPKQIQPQEEIENPISKQIQEQQNHNGHTPLNQLERQSFSPAQQLPQLGFTSSLRELTQEVRSNNLKETLFHSENIEMKTRLNGESVALIAISRMVASKYGIPELMGFCDDIMQLRVSLKGEGRKEGVQMEQGQNMFGQSGTPRM